MADLIEADYGKLEQVHKQFSRQADTMNKMIKDIRARMAPLQDGGWKGDAADAFFSEMHGEVLPACLRLRKALREAASTTKRIGKTVQKAEQDAKSAFKIF